MDAVKLLKKLASLKTQRIKHEPKWREAFELSAPEMLPSFIGGVEGVNDQRTNARRKLYDTTLVDSTQLLVSSIIGGTTTPNQKWFNLKPVGLDTPEQMTDGDKWLGIVSDFLFKNIHASTFDSIVSEYVLNLVVAGWAVMFITSDKDKGGFHFENWDIGNTYISSTRADGIIDTVYKEYSFTAEQLVNEFGYDNLSDKIKKAYDSNKRDQQFNMLHAIYPRDKKDIKGEEGKRLNKNMPFASIHIDISSKHIVNESGFESNPCVVARLKKLVNSHYGIGKVDEALEDAKTVNEIMKLNLQASEMALAGMWIAQHDGVLSQNLRIRPRAVIMANSVDSLKRLDTPIQALSVGLDMVQHFSAKIKSTMLSNQLTPVGNAPLTATEVSQRVQTNRMQMSALFGRLTQEYLNGLLERCWSIAMGAGVLPPAPEELMQASRVTFIYTNPLANASKLEGVIATQQLMAGVGELSQLDPNILDNVDLDAVIQTMADGYGVPVEIINTSEEVINIRKAKADAQAKAQEQQAAMQGQQAMANVAGEVAVNTAKNMSPDQIANIMENGIE